MDGARSGFSAALLVVLERDLAPLVRGAPQRGEELVRATRRWGGGGHAAGESGVQVARLGGQLVGELAQRGDDGGIGRRRLLCGARERERLERRELRRPRERLVEHHRDSPALVHADVDQIVGREGRPPHEPEQVDVLHQLVRREAQLAGELFDADARAAARRGDDEQQPAQPLLRLELLADALPGGLRRFLHGLGRRCGLDRHRRFGLIRWRGSLQAFFDRLQ